MGLHCFSLHFRYPLLGPQTTSFFNFYVLWEQLPCTYKWKPATQAGSQSAHPDRSACPVWELSLPTRTVGGYAVSSFWEFSLPTLETQSAQSVAQSAPTLWLILLALGTQSAHSGTSACPLYD